MANQYLVDEDKTAEEYKPTWGDRFYFALWGTPPYPKDMSGIGRSWGSGYQDEVLKNKQYVIPKNALARYLQEVSRSKLEVEQKNIELVEQTDAELIRRATVELASLKNQYPEQFSLNKLNADESKYIEDFKAKYGFTDISGDNYEHFQSLQRYVELGVEAAAEDKKYVNNFLQEKGVRPSEFLVFQECLNKKLRYDRYLENRVRIQVLEKLLADFKKGLGVFNNVVVAPFYKVYGIPDPKTGEPGKINLLALLWLPRLFDFLFEGWNSLCDYIGNKYGLLGKVISYGLRFPVKILQNAINMVMHLVDTWIMPFINVYKMYKADEIGGGKAFLYATLHFLKIGIMALLIASLFAAPLAAVFGALTNALASIPGYAAATSAIGTALAYGTAIVPSVSIFVPGALSAVTAAIATVTPALVATGFVKEIVDPFTDISLITVRRGGMGRRETIERPGMKFFVPTPDYPSTQIKWPWSSPSFSSEVTRVPRTDSEVAKKSEPALKTGSSNIELSPLSKPRSGVLFATPTQTRQSSANEDYSSASSQQSGAKKSTSKQT